MNYYLCLDQGGQSSRALIVDAHGAVIAKAQRAVATYYPKAGWVEHDPAQVVASLREVAGSAMRELSVAQRRQVCAAGLVTQRASLVCWHRSDLSPLSNIVSWQDVRAAPWLAENPLPPALYRTTGLRPNAHLGASKYRWCLDHLAAVADAAAHNDLYMGPLAAFLVQQLACNAPFHVDPANASRTLLWDIERRDWSEALLQFFGVARAWFPATANTIDNYGELYIDDVVVPLRLLNGDQSAAALAYGWPQPNTAAINLGTGAFIFAPLEAPLPNAEPLLTGIAHADRRTLYTLEGTVHGAASALTWWAQRHARDDYAPLLDVALRAGISPLLFINAIGGLGSPDWRYDIDSELVGAGDAMQELAAIAESIVFLLQRNLDVMQTKIDIRQLRVSGGLARSDNLCQRLADLSGLSVQRFVEQEASILGAAFALAGQPQYWLPATQMQEFFPTKNEALHARYRVWSEIFQDKLQRVWQ